MLHVSIMQYVCSEMYSFRCLLLPFTTHINVCIFLNRENVSPPLRRVRQIYQPASHILDILITESMHSFERSRRCVIPIEIFQLREMGINFATLVPFFSGTGMVGVLYELVSVESIQRKRSTRKAYPVLMGPYTFA